MCKRVLVHQRIAEGDVYEMYLSAPPPLCIVCCFTSPQTAPLYRVLSLTFAIVKDLGCCKRASHMIVMSIHLQLHLCIEAAIAGDSRHTCLTWTTPGNSYIYAIVVCKTSQCMTSGYVPLEHPHTHPAPPPGPRALKAYAAQVAKHKDTHNNPREAPASHSETHPAHQQAPAPIPPC